MGLLCAPYPPTWRWCARTRSRAARGLRHPAADSARRGFMAHAAARSPAVGGRLPADAAVALCRRLRGDDARPPEGPAALGFLSQAGPYGRDPRTQPHLALDARERLAGGLRRRQAPDEGSKVHAAATPRGTCSPSFPRGYSSPSRR
jgi:hypothetical protein